MEAVWPLSAFECVGYYGPEKEREIKVQTSISVFLNIEPDWTIHSPKGPFTYIIDYNHINKTKTL